VRHFVVPQSSRKAILVGTVAILGAVFAAFGLLIRYWPFTEDRVRSELGDATSSQVRIGSFQHKYFPPGCVASDVAFQRAGSNAQLISVRRLSITSSVQGLFRHRVNVRAEGARVVFSPKDAAPSNTSQSQTVVDELTADDAVLEVPRRKSNLKFTFRKFSIRNLGSRGQITFVADFDNPLPRGALRTSGKFGPWNPAHPEQTAVSGKYSLQRADFGVFDGLGGFLSSEGEFSGAFKNIEVQGSTDMPGFELTSTGHRLPLSTKFNALVDATSGNVLLRRVQAKLGKTEIDATGTIARQPGQHRIAQVQLDCERGTIDDVFYLFVRKKSPLSGGVAFSMKVQLPAGEAPFLKRVKLESNFRIQDARFTNPETQEKINNLSQKADDHADQNALALSDLTGEVRLEHGLARFSDLSMQDPGASAKLAGTYDLTGEKIDMHGRLRTTKGLSNGTHGMKKAVLKIIGPFFKKNPKESEAPIKISGTYHHPAFGLDVPRKM
jgi:hypothetical protein